MTELARSWEVQDQNESQKTTDSQNYSSPVLNHSLSVPNRNVEAMPLQTQRKDSSQATTASIYGAGENRYRSQENDQAGQHQQVIDLTLDSSDASQGAVVQPNRMTPGKRDFEDFNEEESLVPIDMERIASEKESIEEDDMHLLDSQESSLSARALEARRTAFNTVLRSSSTASWAGLLSTTDNHTYPESELGEL